MNSNPTSERSFIDLTAAKMLLVFIAMSINLSRKQGERGKGRKREEGKTRKRRGNEGVRRDKGKRAGRRC